MMIIFYQLARCGRVAEWLGKGLQNLLPRFKSGRDLKFFSLPGWWNGIHEGLKIPWEQSLVGSNPTPGTL